MSLYQVTHQAKMTIQPSAPYALFLLAYGIFVIANLLFQLFLPSQVGLMASQWIGFLASAFLFRHLWHTSKDDRWPALNAWRMDIKSSLVLVILGSVLAVWVNMVGSSVVAIFPSLGEAAKAYVELNRKMLMPDQTWLAVIAAMTVSLNAPLCEEILFRGAILPAQRHHKLPIWLICVMNGLLFGGMHLSAIAMLPLTCLGAFLAYLTVRTKSIWPAIVVHALVNLINGVIFPRVFPQSTTTSSPPLLTVLPVALGLTVLCVGLSWLLFYFQTSHQTKTS